MDAAREFLDIIGGSDFLETSPGSGEGLLGAYVFTKTAKGEPPKIVQTRVAVLLDPPVLVSDTDLPASAALQEADA